jgi:CRISPR/Cas system-associated exonuclease Cas4 (RecB family)
MNHIGKIEYRKIKRISPSQYFSLRNCAYKSILSEAFGKNPLLPLSPSAYLGTVLHKILELIAKGIIRNEDDFNKHFDEQITSVEDDLRKLEYWFSIPLQKNVRDFGMKKILLKKHLKSVSEGLLPRYERKFQSEKWLTSIDSLIAGKIDLVIEENGQTEIIDFKTGAVKQDVLDDAGEIFTEIKEEYQEQLKIYAYLYFENTGKFPDHLSIVDLSKQKFPVEFTQSECFNLYKEAKSILDTTNESIENGTFSANPNQVNCRYCLYRPACSFYLNYIEYDYSLNDVIGSLKDVKQFQNGNVSIFLENGERKITITSFPSEKYEELNSSKNKTIGIFNLRKEVSEYIYSATKTTIVYE